MLKKISRWAGCSLQRFAADKAGNVILMFTGASICLMLIAAGAIELHRRNLAVAQLQNAADSASLAGKQRQIALVAKGTKGAAARSQAQSYANDMFNQAISSSKAFASPKPTPTYTWNADGSLTVAVAQKYNVMFSKVFPGSFQTVSVKSVAAKSSSLPTEVAMVLDTTASMFNKDGRPDTRFTLMRNAAKSFANQLFDAAESAGDVNLIRVSVVPWATTVNIKGEAPKAANFTAFGAPAVPDKGSQVQVAAPIARAVDMTGTNFAPVQWRGCITGDTEAAGVYTDAGVANFKALQVAAGPTVMLDYAEGPLTATPVTTVTQNEFHGK